MKYEILNIIRDKNTMFWLIAFPLFLMTIFVSALPSSDYKMKINAYISPENPAAEDIKHVEVFNFTISDDYEEVLKSNEIYGYIDKNNNVLISKNNFKATMIKSLVDNIKRIERDPKVSTEVIMGDFVKSNSKPFQYKKSFFYSLIAMISYMFAYTGVSVVEMYQANITQSAMRFSISPANKLKYIIYNFLVGIILQIIVLTISIIYAKYVLGEDMISNYPLTYLAFIVGSIFAFSLGLMTVYFGNISSNARGALTQTSMMILSGGAGLYGTFFRNAIDNMLGKIADCNPVKIVTDSIYKANIIGEINDMRTPLIILSVVSAVFTLLATYKMKENRYDSI